MKVNQFIKKFKIMDQKKDKPMMAQLREMDIDETLTFPIERMSSLKSMASTKSAEWDKDFTTSMDRKARTISITRIR